MRDTEYNVIMTNQFSKLVQGELLVGNFVDYQHMSHVLKLGYIATDKGVKHYAYMPFIGEVTNSTWVEVTPGRYNELELERRELYKSM